jgi:hypothetical protein
MAACKLCRLNSLLVLPAHHLADRPPLGLVILRCHSLHHVPLRKDPDHPVATRDGGSPHRAGGHDTGIASAIVGSLETVKKGIAIAREFAARHTSCYTA